ncbi:glycosyltransferase [Actinocorallia longicatena]|uniref:Glycosyltransferase family 2 protein n=1 Tax=Actinocorallia longicatena TaxID=111803 RepID=A0ABP6QF12_9ACTN
MDETTGDVPRSRLPRNKVSPSVVGKVAAFIGITSVCAIILWHVIVKVMFMRGNIFIPLYTILVAGYMLSRFLLAAFYRPPRDAGITPSIAIVVPAYNESSAVARTIHSLMALEYPPHLLEIVVINDGSTDDTWDHMVEAASQYAPGRVRCVNPGVNQGKRKAMAVGIRETRAEILVFVDSDSMPAPNAVYKLVQGFADKKVGAISGLTYVRNAETNALTRMQAARYYVSFQLLKSAESVLNAVTCCSGCFAAYRRAAVTPLLDQWENQTFLGRECTHGDDRALTARVIKTGWKTIYDSQAEAWTDAPDEYRKFFKQQLRWKKSWSREGPMLLSHVWRSRPLALLPIAIQTMAGLLSPFVIAYSLAVPIMGGKFPIIYFLGLYMVAMAFALLYRMFRNDGLWLYAFFGTFFYISFSPQLVWAILRIRDGKWGTRPSTAGTTNISKQERRVARAGKAA